MKALKILFICCAMTVALTGCGVWIKNVDVSNKGIVATNPSQPLTLMQISAAIQQAGLKRGWQMRQDGPNKIIASHKAMNSSSNYSVVVEVSYTESLYSITYVSSENFDAKDGKIHRKYATWVINLQRDIDEALSTK
jgi:hypothetical protein